jgi:pimeloyl-ACP methyl ester carboxylesterase
MEGPNRAVSPTRWRRQWLSGWLLVASLAACGGGGAPAPDVLGPDEAILGGTLAISDGPLAGAALTVPPGALAAPIRCRISAVSGDLVSLFPVLRFEPAALSTTVPLRVTVPIGATLFDDLGGDGLACCRRSGPATEWSLLGDSEVDAARRLVTASTTQLGEVVAWNGGLHRLFTQQAALLDPVAPVATEVLGGVPITIAGGSGLMTIGRGSLASFWNSGADENLLIVHGLIGSPLDFLGANDFVQGLGPQWRNIVLLAYPSASGVASNANWLYDRIQAERGPGWGCSILGHSMGGLVARYLLERSAVDPVRPGFDGGDQPLGAAVANLMLLGVPNAGSDLGSVLVATILPLIPSAEQYRLQAAIDLSYRPDAVTMSLNASYVDNPTRYHVLYGDLGAQSDGVVNVASALALPLFGPETATAFAVGHDQLHTEAAQNGVLVRVQQLLTLP